VALATIKTAMDSTDLQGRFEAACYIAAFTIINEATNVANHANRLVWANEVATMQTYLKTTATKCKHMALATNAALQTSGVAAADSDIEYIVITEILGNPTKLGQVR
jgi:hypothetical protein